MILIKSNIILFKGYIGFVVAPFVFVRKDWWDSSLHTDGDRNKVLQHERIHIRQQVECLWVGFFLLYAVFYLVGLVRYGSHKKAYRENLFEREAYGHQDEEGYLERRKWWGWLRKQNESLT